MGTAIPAAQRELMIGKTAQLRVGFLEMPREEIESVRALLISRTNHIQILNFNSILRSRFGRNGLTLFDSKS